VDTQLLQQRFGMMKRQQLPYTHAGIQLEKVNAQCIRLHQDAFTEKLQPFAIPKDRLADPSSPCDAKEKTIFRSLTCSALWACQTRSEEAFNVVSLQTKLQTPTIAEIIAINAVIKRLRKNPNRFGIYSWRLTPPRRVVCISDASSPNKTSDFATEGIVVGICEDRLDALDCDKDDYLDSSHVPLLGGKLHILAASSQKSKRISHSTSHAETLASAKAIPLAQLVAMRCSEPEFSLTMRNSSPLSVLELQENGRCPIMIDAYVDCMDLWELCCGLRGTPQDKSQRLGVLAIREERRTLRLRRLYHIRTQHMLADMLTKATGVDSRSLLELLSSGHWTLGSTARVRQGFGASA
jgi:hypothetical protein